ncbi:flagellar basal body P-ring formation chaperone FlgA [Natronospira proteinivora]|nr:flagellar basal body P-ring formation chaperone FlgA [Natronospira proteinivora]
MNRRLRHKMTALAGFLALPGILLADQPEWQDHAEIRQVAESFVQSRAGSDSQVSARAGRIDNRMRLRHCQQGLEAWLPTGRQIDGGNTTIGVRCTGPVEWQIFVPVSMEIITPVVVIQDVLQRGSVIGPEHVTLEKRDAGTLRRNFYQSLDEVLGMRLRRNLSPGTVLEPGHLEIRRLVERGQRVRLLAKGEAVSVSMAGKALQDGARGQRIRVENLSSGKELEGVITGEGTVEIRF